MRILLAPPQVVEPRALALGCAVCRRGASPADERRTGPAPAPAARAAAVVARAGRPQLIVPHILDQHYWAHRVERLGLGPRALPIEAVTTERLIPRLRSLIESPDAERVPVKPFETVTER